jgi:uncharacterized protein (TIGR02391 family)
MHLADIIPDADVLLALQPDELGLRKSLDYHSRPHSGLTLDIGSYLNVMVGAYPPQHHAEVRRALREAWAWLEGAALLIPSLAYVGAHDVRELSRTAIRLAKEPDAFRALSGRKIPRDALSPRIREDVWSLFHRGKYDTAVFEAMKAVEVAVRQAAGLAAKDIGVALMRKAFDKNTGPLTDMSMDEGEREMRSHFFAGAIGSYKNPHSHRNVAQSGAKPASCLDASLVLLRLVRRKSASHAPLRDVWID